MYLWKCGTQLKWWIHLWTGIAHINSINIGLSIRYCNTLSCIYKHLLKLHAALAAAFWTKLCHYCMSRTHNAKCDCVTMSNQLSGCAEIECRQQKTNAFISIYWGNHLLVLLKNRRTLFDVVTATVLTSHRASTEHRRHSIQLFDVISPGGAAL